VIVVLVAAQMFGHAVDALGEQRDLHIGRAGVAGVEPVLLNNNGSVGLGEGHSQVLLLDGRSGSCFHLRRQQPGGGTRSFNSFLLLNE
jgi:hypothetical protein